MIYPQDPLTICLLHTNTNSLSQRASFHVPLRVGYISTQCSLGPFGSFLNHLKYSTGANVDTHIHLFEAQSVAPIHACSTCLSENISCIFKIYSFLQTILFYVTYKVTVLLIKEGNIKMTYATNVFERERER